MTFKNILTRSTRFTGILLLSVTVIAVLGIVLLSHASGLNQLAAVLAKHAIYLSLLRYGFILLFIAYYPQILRRVYNNKPDINQQALAKYSRRRYPIIFFIILEILIAQHRLAWLINSIIN